MYEVIATINQKKLIEKNLPVKIIKPANGLPLILSIGESRIEIADGNKKNVCAEKYIAEIKNYFSNMSELEFLYDCGFCMTADIINNKTVQENLIKGFNALKNGDIEIAPEIEFIDNSKEAEIAREILFNRPRCTKKEFEIEAFLLAKQKGFDESVAINAIVNYH